MERKTWRCAGFIGGPAGPAALAGECSGAPNIVPDGIYGGRKWWNILTEYCSTIIPHYSVITEYSVSEWNNLTKCRIFRSNTLFRRILFRRSEVLRPVYTRHQLLVTISVLFFAFLIVKQDQTCSFFVFFQEQKHV